MHFVRKFNEMRHQIIKLCHQYFRLAKLAALGFDPLAALVQAKQEVADNDTAIKLMDEIGVAHSQLANTVITDPKEDINRSISDLKNTQNAYNGLVHRVSQLHDISSQHPSVGYYAENIMNDANTVISQIQQTSLALAGTLPALIQEKFINAVLSASDEYISDEELAAQEEAYGVTQYEEPTEEEGLGFQPSLFEEELEEKHDPFAELAEESEAKKEMAYDVRRDKVLETKRKTWHKLFNSAKPQNPELWKQVLNETESRFGEVSSEPARGWAWREYAQRGGQWDMYRDIHAEREALRRSKMMEDPEKYEKELRRGRERARKSRQNISEEKRKERLQQEAKRKREKRQQRKEEKEMEQLEQLRQLLQQSFRDLSSIFTKQA